MPIFKQKSNEIDNFQSNFNKLKPGNKITVGTKTLTFIKISNSTLKRPSKTQLLKEKLDYEYEMGLSDTNSTNMIKGSLPKDKLGEKTSSDSTSK